MCLGCPEVPSSIPVTYTLPECPEGSPCEEYSYTDCIQYKGPNLPTLGITNDMSLKDALAKLNTTLSSALVTNNYTITVATGQSTTIVEYLNYEGTVVSQSVSVSQSPVVICALVGTPVKLSGTGTLSEAGIECSAEPV